MFEQKYEKYYCKKDFYMSHKYGDVNDVNDVNDKRIFLNGKYYDVYAEDDEYDGIISPVISTVFAIYKYEVGIGKSGYRFWLYPDSVFPEIDDSDDSDDKFVLDKFSDYFINVKELRKLKLDKLNENI